MLLDCLIVGMTAPLFQKSGRRLSAVVDRPCRLRLLDSPGTAADARLRTGLVVACVQNPPTSVYIP